VGIYVSHPSSHSHDTGPHPENAGRLVAIEAALEAEAWLGLDRLEAPRASREQLTRVHTAEHVDAIEEFCARGGGMIDLDTVAGPGSYEAALHAAGGAAAAAERLLAGESDFAFAALRPPGHHAEPAAAMGFCLFNNAAIAAAHSLHACGAERVLILDWDVHHGNGTEAIFAASADVLYASIHQWPLYPGTGAADYRGEGAGEGYTLNLPVPPGSGSEEFLALVEHVVVPAGRELDPGLIVLSAGYDAHRDDPLASCTVETTAYGEMAAAVRALGAETSAPVLACLEGGYSPRALAASVIATIRGLAGEIEPRSVPAEAAEPHLSRVTAGGR
jgi:acetoin utilization deacetylase AcuC-like enzyme